jgi:hypothetical protein
VTSAITDRDFTIATIVPSSGMSTSDSDESVPADAVPATDATRGAEDKDSPAQTQS